MADNNRSFAPGTLDNTRKNIGPIDAEEAKEMQRKLGGEVLPERAEPVDTSNMPRRAPRHSKVVRSSRSSSGAQGAAGNAASTGAQSASSSQSTVASKIRIDDEGLPPMSSHDLKLIDELMMSPEYGIKPNYGVFNFLYRMSSRNRRKVMREFVTHTLKSSVEHLQSFVGTIKTFIQISPDTYKAKIATDTELKFKFLRTVGKWAIHNIKAMQLELEAQSDNLTIASLVPFVQAVYRQLLTIYYIGEQKIPVLIKEIFSDISENASTKIGKGKAQKLAKQAITEWLYVHDQLIKGMYPLLMRMCATEYVEFPRFFMAQVSQILKFVNLTKFDLLVPEKKKKQAAEGEEEEEKTEEKEEEEQKSKRHVAGEKDDIVLAGFQILEQLFPEAGFTNLESYPDMFPYFQPLYKFNDGFNTLSPRNGLQVTLVLIRILEDLFQGCRNIAFNFTADDSLVDMTDDLSEVFSEWSYYREDLFDKKYGDYLRPFVNAAYSQKDYPSSQYGKESINNMLWKQKYYFFPYYKFNAPTLTKPVNDSKYKPLYARTDYMRTLFTTLVRRIDENQAGRKPVLGITNPWDRYVFDVPNTVSKRLDVLLGAKKDDESTNATNANLLKYTLLIMAVLDWWINNPSSPVYTTDTSIIYRISEKDGAPEFSVPMRNDQNQLFAASVKKAIASKKG